MLPELLLLQLLSVADKLFGFVKDSQVILGAGGALLAHQTGYLLYNQQLPITVIAFLFSAIVAAYTFIGVKISVLNQKIVFEFSHPAPVRTIVAWSSLGATLFFFFLLDKKIQAVGSILCVATMAYMTPFFINRVKVKGIRDFFLLKSVWLSLVWSIATVLIPSIHFKGFYFENKELVFFAQRFLFILAIALAFNIRDYEYDLKRHMKTITTITGIARTKAIAFFLLALSLAVMFLLTFINAIALAFIPAILYTAFLVGFAKPATRNFFYVVLMDGAVLVQGLLLLLTSRV